MHFRRNMLCSLSAQGLPSNRRTKPRTKSLRLQWSSQILDLNLILNLWQDFKMTVYLQSLPRACAILLRIRVKNITIQIDLADILQTTTKLVFLCFDPGGEYLCNLFRKLSGSSIVTVKSFDFRTIVFKWTSHLTECTVDLLYLSPVMLKPRIQHYIFIAVTITIVLLLVANAITGKRKTLKKTKRKKWIRRVKERREDWGEENGEDNTVRL